MPARITLSALSFSTPDGTQLFSNLDLAFSRQRTGLVGRNGVGKSTLFKLITGALTPQSGSVTIDGTTGLLRQSLKAEPGETIADLFGATARLETLARAASGTATADELADADWTIETRLEEALARFSLPVTAETPLETLSGGQRTRAILAALVFADPDFLLLDEPTNNLDLDSIAAVEAGLRGYDGALLVVSHDRPFLDAIGVTREIGLGG